MKDKKKKYTCDTCNFSIYENDNVYKSRTITYSSRTGTAYSYYKYGGTRQKKNWIQCQWCMDEYNKEQKKHDIFINKWKWIKWAIILISVIGWTIYGYSLERSPNNVNNSFTTNKSSILFPWILGSWFFTYLLLKLLWNYLLYDWLAPKANRYQQRDYRKENE